MTSNTPNKSVRKIAVLLPSAGAGGAEKLIIEELSLLRLDPRFYFEVHLVFEAGIWYDRLRALGVPVYVWRAPHKSSRMLLSYLSIVRYLRRQRFDIIHVHLLNYWGAVVGRLAGVKVITTVHIDCKFRFFERICLRQCDLLFACGAQVKRNIESFIPIKKLRLLNNAIRVVLPEGSEPEDILRRLGISKGDKVITSLGRLTGQKGYDVLIEAIKIVVKQEPRTLLLIAGDGPDKENLQRQIISTSMQEHIRLLGHVNNVYEIIKICYIYVNASRFEGLPMSLIEAMAHEKPIVATAVGGNCEVVKDRYTGLLVPPERPDLLAEGLLRLMRDEKLVAQLAEKAFELFKDKYSIEKHCKILALEYLNI